MGKKQLELYTTAAIGKALGLAKTTRLNVATLPEPDAIINDNKPAWTLETLQKWKAGRPGSGNWAASRAKKGLD